MIRYTFLFVLLFIGAVGFVGCQTFAPEYDANVTSTKKIKTNRNKVGFFESAKNLFLPDFDNENENDTENLKVASRKSESQKQQTQSKPAQKYAFGNSLSTNPQQNNISLNPNLLPPSFSPYFVNNINTNLTSQQNDLVTKNTSPITPTSNDTAISEQIAQNKDVVDKNTDVLTGVASSKNFVETAKADSETTTVAKTEPNKTQTIKKYAVDSLLPQSGDSEKFRSFLKELAEIPADQLKVDETELVDRITAFREECRVIKNPKIEMVALDYLREDILPDFLTDKKIKNKENTVAVSKPISTSNKKNNPNSKRKLDFEQVAYSEQHDNKADDLYGNDNSDDKNAPLPSDVQPTGKKKQRLSSIPSRGFESENYNDSASNQSQPMPTLPQLKTPQSSTFSQNNFPDENRVDKKFSESKFVSYSPNQTGNVVNANYAASNQNTNYPINSQQQQFSSQMDNWEMQVRNAITSLRREMETLSAARTFSNEVKLRLLELSVGNRGEAMKQFGTAEKPVNEFWTNQMLGLSTIMDELVIPNHTMRYDAALLRFDESTTALRQVCPLRLKNVQLIQQDDLEAHYISSFGNYQTRSEECKPSEIIAIYLELENPTIKSSSQGYTIRLSVDCEILDTNSRVVQKEENKIVEDLSTVQKHDHFIKMLVELKRKLPHGYYKLRIRVTDLNSHDSQKTAEEQIPIRIVQ